MLNAVNRLQSLRVGDVMNREIVSVRARQPMCEVAALFRNHEISAAPVVNEHGHCIGIISATDFLSRDAGCGSQHSPGSRQCACRATVGNDDIPSRASLAEDDVVCDWMTKAVQTVAPSTRLAVAAKIMCAQHVHRLVVVEHGQQVIGMISTMDIVSAVVNALDELQIAS
jgi:CBS-domain-containing membrane protein